MSRCIRCFGQAGFIYDSLNDCVDQIKVVNPSKMTWIYRTSKKNDRLDARKMSVLLSIGELPAVHIPSREVRQWRQMILHRRKIINGLTQAKNRIRALLKSEGFRQPQHGGGWWKKVNRLRMQSLCQDRARQGELWAVQLGNLPDEPGMIESQLVRVTQYLDEYLERQPGGKLLMSIKGVGPRTSEAVLAYTDDVSRFGDSKTFCSYFGMTPRLDESGSCHRFGHISKEGPSVVRWVLIESSWKVIRYNRLRFIGFYNIPSKSKMLYLNCFVSSLQRGMIAILVNIDDFGNLSDIYKDVRNRCRYSICLLQENQLLFRTLCICFNQTYQYNSFDES